MTDSLNGARMLVTGGAGFVGGYLVRELVDRGAKVTVVDNFSVANRSDVGQPAGVDVVERDITQGDLTAVLHGHDVVFHLAAAVGVKRILREPLTSMITNIEGTMNVLRCAPATARVMLASTSEVYGKSTVEPLAEDGDLMIGPPSVMRWSYAAAKIIDEFLIRAYRQSAMTIVRLFNTVGPGQASDYGMVIPGFCRAALRREPLTVYGDGGQRRCFTSVRDVARCLCDLAVSDRATGQTYNVSSQNEITILDLARLVRRVADSRSEIEFVAYADAYGSGYEDVRRRWPDVSKLRIALGYVPETSIESIVADVLEFERARMKP